MAHATLQLPSDEMMMAGPLEENTLLAAMYQNKSVSDVLNETIVSIRENIRLTQAIRLQLLKDDTNNNNKGRLVGYVHGRVDVTLDAGTAAAIVQVQPKDSTSVSWDPSWQEAGKKLAMHVVAAKPLYLNPNSVPAEVLEKERAILAKQVRVCV